MLKKTSKNQTSNQIKNQPKPHHQNKKTLETISKYHKFLSQGKCLPQNIIVSLFRQETDNNEITLQSNDFHTNLVTHPPVKLQVKDSLRFKTLNLDCRI